MLVACDCYKKYCRHNPPKGMRTVTRKNHPGYWFVKVKMSFFERFYRTVIQDYVL